jgi:predicted ATPase/DNA-binding XRE family transcriptional regulator
MKDNLAGPFGEILRKHRLRRGLSQEQLAEKARLSLTAVGALERGTRRAPYRETVTRLAVALGLDAAEQEAFEKSTLRARRKTDGEPSESLNRDLPASRTSFTGREDDIKAINNLLEGSRLVTLVGSGGVGKTRLSLEVARQPPNERWSEARFVDLSPLVEGAYVAGAIASTVLQPLPSHVDTVDALVRQLAERRMLLILDNCEHLIDDVVVVVHAILLACPGVTILATSRVRLSVQEGASYRVPSFAVPDQAPDTLEAARDIPVLNLFMERAQMSDPQLNFVPESLGTIVEICRRLDGIPLAIELVASRVGVLGLRSILERIHEHLSLPSPSSDVPERQRTVLATVAWSCDLLAKPERDLLFRLSVFANGFTLEAIEAVCLDQSRGRVLQLLTSLIDRSLVIVVHAGDRVRYMLLDSVRAYGRGQLERLRRRVDASRRHAQWIAGVADRIGALAQLTSYEAFRELILELDNARAAMAWAFEAGVAEDREIGARIICGLRDLWRWSYRFDEYRHWLEMGLAKIDEARQPMVVAELLRNMMVAVYRERSAVEFADRARVLFERHGNARSRAIFHLTALHIYSTHGRFEDADVSGQLALELLSAEEMLSTMWHAMFLTNRATMRIEKGDLKGGKADSLAGAELSIALGNEYYAMVRCLPRLYAIENDMGNYRAAIEIANHMMRSKYAKVPEIEIQGLEMLTLSWVMLGDTEKAARFARLLLERTHGATIGWFYIGAVVALLDKGETTATLIGFVDSLRARSPLAYDRYIERCCEIMKAATHSRLPPDIFAARSAAGAALTEHQACELALAVLA